MTPIGKQMILLEKKLQLIDNDLFKNTCIDVIKYFDQTTTGGERARTVYASYIDGLKKELKTQLHKLRKQSQGKTRQMDIEDTFPKPTEVRDKW